MIARDQLDDSAAGANIKDLKPVRIRGTVERTEASRQGALKLEGIRGNECRGEFISMNAAKSDRP